MPQADAEHRLACAYGRADELHLGLETGVVVEIGGAHGASHDHQSGHFVEIGKVGFLLLRYIERLRGKIDLLKVGQNESWFLPLGMLQNKNFRFRHGFIVSLPLTIRLSVWGRRVNECGKQVSACGKHASECVEGDSEKLLTVPFTQNMECGTQIQRPVISLPTTFSLSARGPRVIATAPERTSSMMP